MAEPLISIQIAVSAVSDLLFALWVGALASVAMLRRQARVMPVSFGHIRLAAISMLAIACGLSLWVESAIVSGAPLTMAGAAVTTVLTQSHFGSAWIISSIGVMFAALAETRPPSKSSWLGIGGAVIYAAGRAAMTHAADAGDFSLTETVYVAHFCATILWAGSVIVAADALRRWPDTTSDIPNGQVAFCKQLSRLATLALAVVSATGIGIARQHIAPLTVLLFSTPYDRVLIFKVAVVTLAVLLGGCNRSIYLPRMEATACKDDAAFRRARQKFALTITIEAVVLTAVLMLASVLGHISPSGG